MLDFTSLLYASLLGLGLIGAQAALSDKHLSLLLSSPDELARSGYSREVVEDLFLSDLDQVFSTRSVVATPVIASVRERTVLGTMAEMARIGEVAHVLQQRIGANPYRVSAHFVMEGDQPKALLSGNSATQGQFKQTLTGDVADYRALIRRAAQEAARNIDPYFRALYDLQQNDRRDAADLTYADSIIADELGGNKPSMSPARRAAFLNLKGLICLERSDKACALAAFDAAVRADPSFAIARLNRAFTLFELGRHQDAVADAQALLGPPPMSKLKQCIAAAHTLIAVVKWRAGDRVAAQSHFSEAAALAPRATTPLVYWSRMLAASGETNAEVERAAIRRQRDPDRTELHSEIAMLYYWLNETSNQPIARRRVGQATR